MSDFPVHTTDTAPVAARPILEAAKKKFGFVPNLYGVLAGAPALLEGYAALSDALAETSLSPAEQQVVLLATSRENECHYCVAAHSVVASMAGVGDDVVDALRDDRPIAEPRLEALRRFAQSVVRNRGRVGEAELKGFHAAGYTRAQVLEVILGVGMKTLSNYANHIADTPLDAAFEPRAWGKSKAS